MIHSEGIPKDKNTFEEHIKAFADSLDQRIDFLQGKTREVEESKRKTYDELLSKLIKEKKKFMKNLQILEDTGEKEWKEVHKKLDKKLEGDIRRIENTYKRISDKFIYLFDKVE